MDQIRVFLTGGIAIDVSCASFADNGRGYMEALGEQKGAVEKPELLGVFQKSSIMAYLVLPGKRAADGDAR